MSGSTVVTDAASVATAVGSLAITGQLVLARRQLRAGFERTFVDRYEGIIARVPLPVILGEVTTTHSETTQRAFYDYFELCEEELYFRKTGRVSKDTWADWWEGMALHFERPAFGEAWRELNVKARTASPGATRHRVEQFTLLRAAVGAIEKGRPYDPRISNRKRRFARREK